MTISVLALSKVYGTQKAVDSISFEINKGEIVGFLGPNGAGKSTTMKMLTGYILPTEGTAKILGYDIIDDSMEVRKNIGYLAENNPLYLDMYIKEYLSFCAGVHKINKGVDKLIKHLIDLTGLGIEQHKKIGMLSKGYRQRVGLAQALLHNPQILILDEPTTGLDPNQIIEIRNLILEISKEKTIIFSSHILQEVQAICNRVLIINRGKLISDATSADLTNITKGKITLNVKFLNPISSDGLSAISGVEKVITTGDSFKIFADEHSEIQKKLFYYAVEINNPILELSKEIRSLENVFQELTTNTLN